MSQFIKVRTEQDKHIKGKTGVCNKNSEKQAKIKKPRYGCYVNRFCVYGQNQKVGVQHFST